MIEKSIFKDGANKNLTHPRQERGITLIALIITIIVLLILAVVAINAVQDGGIIKHAQDARTDYSKAQVKEEMQLTLNNLKIESAIRETDEVAYLQNKLGQDAEITIGEGKGNFTIAYKGYEIVVGSYSVSTIEKIEKDNDEEIKIITFTINSVYHTESEWNSVLSAEEGMTWAKWVESDYNINNLIIKEDGIGAQGTSAKVAQGVEETEDFRYVPSNEEIIANYEYRLSEY